MTLASALPFIGGALGGLFGGGSPELPAEIQRAYRLAMRNARQLKQFANSPVFGGQFGANERLAMANDLGLMGQQQLGQREALMGAMTQSNMGNLGDFLANLNSQEVGAQMAVRSGHLINALANRRAALSESTQAAATAGGIASGQYQQPPGVGGLIDAFSQMAYAEAFKRSRQADAGPSAADVAAMTSGAGTLAGARARTSMSSGTAVRANTAVQGTPAAAGSATGYYGANGPTPEQAWAGQLESFGENPNYWRR